VDHPRPCGKVDTTLLTSVQMSATSGLSGLTIQEAAETTGWSARMLRYVESAGLVEPDRSVSGYRLYGPGHLQRLRTLRDLLATYEIGLSDVGFAARLQSEPELRSAVEGWLTTEPERPQDVPAASWLRWEQDKHEKLLSPNPVHIQKSLEKEIA
jgi:MerR family copper efflux transcriptional regulator